MESRMVSYPDRRRARRHSLALALAVALGWLACSRQVNIRDEPEGGVTGPMMTFEPDAAIPPVDAGLDMGPACESREEGNCRGTNDFACAFDPWVREVAKDCLTLTGCSTNGWLVVDMGEDGCVSGIGMEQPNSDYVSCLVASFGAYRCPCRAVSFNYHLGFSNDGCSDDNELACKSGEFPCPPGYSCVEQLCALDPAAAGAPGQ